MKTLVTGSGGQLGSEICRQLSESAVPIDIDRLDITSCQDVRNFLLYERPSCVINTAAYTAVDKAETEADRCFSVNSTAVKYLAEATREINCRLIHISTDYVFGNATGARIPWKESDEPQPQGVYARTKRNGEIAAAENPNHLIVRSCGLYGMPGPTATGNFVTTMLKLAKDREFVRVVNDQHCTPTWVVELARAICFLVSSDCTGILHVTNQGATTWFDFARTIFQQRSLNCRVEPITSTEFGSAVPRPSYSVLNTSRYQTLNGPPMSPWEQALDSFLRSI